MIMHNMAESSADTDVVVLAVAAKISIQELWVAFGTGKHFRYFQAHEILGPSKSQALPFFHAISAFGS